MWWKWKSKRLAFCAIRLRTKRRAEQKGSNLRLKLKPKTEVPIGLLALCLHIPEVTRAQAGPPFLTNDPGTPGNANWEVNLGSMQTLARGLSSHDVPQIDLNFGIWDRIQLTYEIPYVLQTSAGRSTQSGWSNAYPGIKWRFLDAGEDGWQVSTFPQIETAASQPARQKGLAAAGPRYLLPLEIAKKVGALDFDCEAGYYVDGHGPKERILGFVVGRPVSTRLELDAEVYDDRESGALPHSTILDLGGRYKLGPGLIALFMAGRSVDGFSNGQPEFIGYFGVQFLLSNYGTRLNSEP
jgi:hypothetical protein